MVESLNKHKVSETRSTSDLELSELDWNKWPVLFATLSPSLTMDLIRSLVSKGGNIHAENSKGHTPLSMVKDPMLKSDMVYITRRSLLLFFEAVCTAKGLKANRSLQRVTENRDLKGCIIRFIS